MPIWDDVDNTAGRSAELRKVRVVVLISCTASCETVERAALIELSVKSAPST